MTKLQEIALEKLKRVFHKRCGFQYEIKEFSVKDYKYFIGVWILAGLPNDENTAAAILCRTYGSFTIGIRGGIKCQKIIEGTDNVKKKYHSQWYKY